MPLDVIGAGFPRTGTHSLQAALGRLGFGPCYHMSEITDPDQARPWCDAFDGRPVDWGAVLAGYRSTSDAPACHFYRVFARLYPDAKVILTLRDPDKWFESAQETILSPLVMRMLRTCGVMELADKAGWGEAPRLRDRDYMIDRFNRHNREVVETIPPERLLVFRAEEEWGPLCRFLGVSEPSDPFPRIAARGDLPPGMREKFETMDADELRALIRSRSGNARASGNRV
jgi:hypothetical protein